jgi:hypothetical protein
MRRVVGLLPCLGILAGCGADGSGVSVESADVSGSWNAAWQGLNGPGLSCSADGGRLELSQTGGRFSGTYRVGTLTCNGMSGGASTGAVVNGTLAEDQVAFDLNDPSLHQNGTISGDNMSGEATWTLVIDGTPYTVTGTWMAVRTCRAAPTGFGC